MSTHKERGRLGDILLREFAAYATALTETGHDWTAWPGATRPPDPRLAWVHGRFLLARECAAAAGLYRTDAQITQEHRERLAHHELFPHGMPSLFD
ncbi:hypothetical protein AB0M39_39675 [Streptomyces sp. NPDC051907]|uniref:hypothetical protein n=1 Tax=Streptomyces sp. NPDC051907 TaxID=3155284 RepID=UPI00341496E9